MPIQKEATIYAGLPGSEIVNRLGSKPWKKEEKERLLNNFIYQLRQKVRNVVFTPHFGPLGITAKGPEREIEELEDFFKKNPSKGVISVSKK